MKKLLFFVGFVFVLTGNAQTELWGITQLGGVYGAGTVFKLDSLCSTPITKYSFFKYDGAYPKSTKLLQASNGKLYGMTASGGIKNLGNLFEYNLLSHSYLVKATFDSNTGVYPKGSLIEASDGKFYGMTYSGGINNFGSLFQYDPILDTLIIKIFFNGIMNGANSAGDLLEATPGKLYGMTQNGGINNMGVLFEYDIATNTLTKKIDFSGSLNGKNPEGSSLIKAVDGKLYGMTKLGGFNDGGVLFQYDHITNMLIKKIDFYGFNGLEPYGSLLQATDNNLYGMTNLGGDTSGVGTIFQYNPVTNLINTKYIFDGINQSKPEGSLIQANNGKLYGLSSDIGCVGNRAGSLFEYDISNSVFTKKDSFYLNNGGGSIPLGTLTQANDGKLYGMTSYGGAFAGVIFSYDLITNTDTILINFQFSTSGSFPPSNFTLAPNGKFYGISYTGYFNEPVIYEYDRNTNIYTKKVQVITNGQSLSNALLLGNDGNLYGSTGYGGLYTDGTLFQYNPLTNLLTTKINFQGSITGANPIGNLILASNGKIYGTTYHGGLNNGLTGNGISGVLFEYDYVSNSIIKKYDSLNYQGYTHELVQATNGKLYGTTNYDLYEFDLINNTYKRKVPFTIITDGQGNIIGSSQELVSLVCANNGLLYGLTIGNGAWGFGTLVRYNPSTSSYVKIKDFGPGIIGAKIPYELFKLSNGSIYGYGYTINSGFSNSTLFNYNITSNNFSVCSQFSSSQFSGFNGDTPVGSLIEVNFPLILQNENFVMNVFISPNPSNGIYHLDIQSKSQITIINFLGQEILSQKMHSGKQQIDITKQPNGIYFVKVESNGQQQNMKLIKE